MKRASGFLRTMAFLIDLLVLVLAGLLLNLFSLLGYALGSGGAHQANSGLSLALLSVLVGLFYFTCLTMGGARTLGKACIGIRVTKLTGDNPGLIRSLWRSCCYLLSGLPFFFGFLIAFIVRGRSLHDFLAGTVVVKEE